MTWSVDNDSGVGDKNRASHCGFIYIYIKRYTTALFKKQWGANLSKFDGVAMVGGVKLNGEQMYSQSLQDIEKLEEEIRGTYETPVTYMIG